MPKKGGLVQFADLRGAGAWQKREGGAFEGGLIPKCTLCVRKIGVMD